MMSFSSTYIVELNHSLSLIFVVLELATIAMSLPFDETIIFPLSGFSPSLEYKEVAYT